jgi:hypothetical protein
VDYQREKFSDAEPLKVKYGERIPIKFINDKHDGASHLLLHGGRLAHWCTDKPQLIIFTGQTALLLLTAGEDYRQARFRHDE